MSGFNLKPRVLEKESDTTALLSDTEAGLQGKMLPMKASKVSEHESRIELPSIVSFYLLLKINIDPTSSPYCICEQLPLLSKHVPCCQSCFELQFLSPSWGKSMEAASVL